MSIMVTIIVTDNIVSDGITHINMIVAVATAYAATAVSCAV